MFDAPTHGNHLLSLSLSVRSCDILVVVAVVMVVMVVVVMVVVVMVAVSTQHTPSRPGSPTTESSHPCHRSKSCDWALLDDKTDSCHKEI
jgi:hypothetical protein